ncbi:phage holin family protein [Devosia albogilva]|uniref:Phage holin family protein n=1 Tax=Devosia albogilva TaxID=429726 RepID=A0ABW5QHH0_9HYPH
MPLLGPLAALLGIEIEAITDRVRTLMIVYAVIGALTLTGLIFLLVAAYLALAQLIGPIYSALVIAVVMLLIAGIVLLAIRMGETRRRREIAQRRRSSEAGAFATTAALTALPAVVRSPSLRLLAIPAAAAAAFVLVRNARKGKDEP